MLQEREVVPLMQRLLDAGYNGAAGNQRRTAVGHSAQGRGKIVDVKCPHSGEPDTFRIDNLETLTRRDEVKFVISDRVDFDFARDFTLRHDLARRVNAILFSPAFAKDATGWRDARHCLLDPEQLVDWMLADNIPARLGLQIHKFIWDPAMKGV